MIALAPPLLAAALLVFPATTATTRLSRLSRCRDEGVENQKEHARASGETTSWLPVLAPAAVGLSVAAWFGTSVGLAWGAFAALGAYWFYRRWPGRDRPVRTDPLLLAAGWDLLAVGMRAGLPVPVITQAVAAEFTGATAKILHEVAALMELGADPVSAWEPALRHPDTAELARAARRSARIGSGMADVAADIAVQARASVSERTQAGAQRAAVWVSAPLGLCFLPAFLCLGVLPVVVGMVQRLTLFW